MRFLFIISIIMISSSAFGQIDYSIVEEPETVNRPDRGDVKVKEEPHIAGIISNHKKYNKDNNRHMGFRIHIQSTATLDEITPSKSTVLINFRELSANVVWEQPYYRLLVGDFRDRVEANYWLKELQKSFPGAYLVPTSIDIEELYDHNR